MNKKLTFFTLAVIYTAFMAVLFLQLWLRVSPIVLLVLIAANIGTLWYFMLQLFPLGDLITKLFLSTIYILVCMLTLLFFPTLGFYAKVSFILVTAGLLHGLLLSTNIYIVSKRQGEPIPLLQPAKTIIFLILVMSTFLGSTILYKIHFLYSFPAAYLIILGLLFYLFYYSLFSSSVWFFNADVIGEEDISYSRIVHRLKLFSAVVLAELAVALSFIPLESFGRAVILGGIVYVLINLVQNYITHKVNLRFGIESVIVITFVYFIVSFL